jgi:hypothetical protein
VYYNTVQPIAQVYDGFLLALTDAALPPRHGVGTKVMRVFTETDTLRGAAVPSQVVPDTDTLRTWYIAGGSHVPAYSTVEDQTDFRATLGGIQTRDFGTAVALQCTNPGPSAVATWAVFHAAYDALDKWVRFGRPPQHSQPLAVVSAGPPASFVRDANGIVLGGIRLPDVEEPIALNNGDNSPANLTNPLNAFCVLWGTHQDFTTDQLRALYLSNVDYRVQVADTVRRLEGQRFLLRDDGLTLIREADRRHVV